MMYKVFVLLNIPLPGHTVCAGKMWPLQTANPFLKPVLKLPIHHNARIFLMH